MGIPTYYSYRSLPEYKARECPTFVIEDAIRLWSDSDAFVDHPPIPGWLNDWSRFFLIKEWIPSLSLWSTHDSGVSKEATCIRVRNRLQSCGKITPILYDISDHSRVILRMGDRVLYCRTLFYGIDEDDSSQVDAIVALTLTYSEFVAADSETIPAHIHDCVAQTSLEDSFTHASVTRKENSVLVIAFAVREGTEILTKPLMKRPSTSGLWMTERRWIRISLHFIIVSSYYMCLITSLGISNTQERRRLFQPAMI